VQSVVNKKSVTRNPQLLIKLRNYEQRNLEENTEHRHHHPHGHRHHLWGNLVHGQLKRMKRGMQQLHIPYLLGGLNNMEISPRFAHVSGKSVIFAGNI
jgi:hypothetical protein